MCSLDFFNTLTDTVACSQFLFRSFFSLTLAVIIPLLFILLERCSLASNQTCLEAEGMHFSQYNDFVIIKETIFSFNKTINGGGFHLSRDNLHFTLHSNTPDCGDGISSEKLNTYKNITNSTIFQNDAFMRSWG